jgi:hypothetical protein
MQPPMMLESLSTYFFWTLTFSGVAYLAYLAYVTTEVINVHAT